MRLATLAAAVAVLWAPGMAPPAQAQTETPLQDEVAELKRVVQEQSRLIERLLERIERLEGAKPRADGGDEPDIPPVELPGGAEDPAPARAAASRLPDISVVGNHVGRFWSVKGDPDRNRPLLSEMEIGLQQPLYPGVRFDAFLAAGESSDFAVSLEEGYVTASSLGSLPLGAVGGRKRLSFGKANAIHPHARAYADQPAPLAAFLGEEALTGNGAALTWTLPVRGLFAHLEAGYWKASAHGHGAEGDEHDEGGEPGAGVAGDFPAARLWLSRELGTAGELELGGSLGFGKAEQGDRIALAGLDLTLRRYMGTFGALTLQGEYLRHVRKDLAGGTGRHARSGHYALLSWKPDQHRELGVRYDSTRFPWPLEGGERSGSLIFTNRLTEATLLRLQLKYGDRTQDHYLPARRGFTELHLQFLWGAGSHTHRLQ